MQTENQFLTIRQVAREFDISEAAVRNRIARGVLPTHKIGYAVLILREDLERALARSPAR